MDKAVIIDHLSYKDSLKDFSLTLQKGEFVGIIGGQDSGKEYVNKIASGLIAPSSGFLSILGYDPILKSPDYLKQIAYLMQGKNSILKDILPIDELEITKSIYKLTNREFNKNLNELTQFIKDPYLLDNLIYLPSILLLDESNLDLESIYQYNNKYESTTLLVTSKFDSLINLVRRVVILNKGKMIFDGAIDEIVTKYATEKVIKAKLSFEIDENLVSEIGTVRKYSYPYIYISVPRSVVSMAAAELVQNFPVTNLNIEELSIEEIIQNMEK